jgi:ABC-2 type transport system permease protein
MGLYAAEKANGTEELLMTSPLTIWDIVLGKFLGGAIFVSFLVLIVGCFPALLFVYGDPEVGKTLGGLIGLMLVAWTYVAIGAFASSITRNQVVAFLITFVLLLTMLLLPAVSDLGVAGDSGAGAVLRYLSTAMHFENLTKGLIDTSDLAYFAAMIGAFLLLSKTAVESTRWR